LRDIAHPVKTALEPGNAELLLQLAGDVQHGAGTDHHGDFGAVHGLHFMKTGVAGQGAQHPQAQFIEQRQGVPELPGDVVFAD
jgi:hypothetical protein